MGPPRERSAHWALSSELEEHTVLVRPRQQDRKSETSGARQIRTRGPHVTGNLRRLSATEHAGFSLAMEKGRTGSRCRRLVTGVEGHGHT